MKSQRIRIAEAMNLRSQWQKHVGVPFPFELVGQMNAFVRDGVKYDGTVDFLGRDLEYSFNPDDDTETFMRLKSSK